MAGYTSLVVFIIALALLFDFLNGFHDAANAIATVVVTKTLSPLQAVALAGIANSMGYFFGGVAVAQTVGKGIIDITYVTMPLILAALIGAILWNIFTWILGLPTSSSHALIGGLVGSGMAAVGFKIIHPLGLLKVFLFIFIAPLLGMIGAAVFTVVIIWLFRKSRPSSANNNFRLLQLVSASVYSVGHGINDAQKTMGVIALTLFSAGISTSFKIDHWVMASCYSAITLGTFFGGWRIVKTMGTRITKIRAMEGFCAETSSAIVLLGTAHLGIPVSTTHVIAGSIMGVGSVEHVRNVRWVTARSILWAWILTIPATALIAGASYYVVSIFM
jgi:inorganic phosphate transporter, PiT family